MTDDDCPVEKTEMPFEEMAACLELWDQTIGCQNCGRAWWAENATPVLEDFHQDACPLKGRRDVHEAAKLIDYDYLDANCADDHSSPPAESPVSTERATQ